MLPNDPLYLTAGTSCPAPFADKPMFQPWATKTVTVPLTVTEGNKEVIRNYPVTIRFAHAREMARVSNSANPFNGSPGDTKYGKHAAQNVGVSLMRADRELELEEGFVSKHTPATERWWGVEVEFPPALDDVFGVTHTKQSATHFSALVRGSEMDEIKTLQDVTDRRAERIGDPQAYLFEVAYEIEQGIRDMRNLLREQTEGTGTTRRPAEPEGTDGNGVSGDAGSDNAVIVVTPKPSPEAAGTSVTDRRKESQRHGDSDADETAPPEVRARSIEHSLKNIGVAPEKARRISDEAITQGNKYQFVRAVLDSSAFFGLRSAGGVLLVILNMAHPAYDKLISVLESDTGNDSPYALRNKLADAADALKLMLEAWARYEDELPKNGPDQAAARQVREDWGRMAKSFLADQ